MSIFVGQQKRETQAASLVERRVFRSRLPYCARALPVIACLVVLVRPGRGQRIRLERYKVERCPVADSALGQPDRDVKGDIRAYYDAAKDSSYLVAGDVVGPIRATAISASLRLAGRGPSEHPAVQVTIMTRGAIARELLDADEPPRLKLVIDDSLAVDLGAGHIGQYQGPRDRAIIPLSFLLHGEAFRSAAAAGRLALEFGEWVVRWDGSSRDDLHALYHAAQCAQPKIRRG